LLAKYDDRDYGTIVNNVFHELYLFDQEGRNRWYDITLLADKVGAAHKNVSDIVQYFLIDERRFVERDPQNNNKVRITALGREKSAIDIHLSQSDIQKFLKRLGEQRI
jgi:hypothetical protein